MVQIFVPTLTTSQVCPWAHPDPSYHSCSRMMWGWSTLKKQKTDQKEEVWQGSFVKCMELTGFYWPRSFPTWITPSESREVIGRTYKEWGNFIPETRWKTFPSREERKKQNALCEGDVNRCATPPSKACTSPIKHITSASKLGVSTHQLKFFLIPPQNPQTFQHQQHGQQPLSYWTPPPNKIRHQPPAASEVSRFFLPPFVVVGLSTAASCRKVVTLTVGVTSVFQGLSGRWRASIQLMTKLNLSIWAVLLQYQFSPTCIHHPLPSWIRRPNVIQPFWKCDEYTYGFSHHNDSDLPCIKAKKGYASNSSMDIFGSSNRRWEG